MRVGESWENLFNYLQRLQAGHERYRVVGERLPALVRGLALYDDRPEESSGGFVHYTSWENMLKILAVDEDNGPRFRMYNYEMTNDPEEGNLKPPKWIQFEKSAREFFCDYMDESSQNDTMENEGHYRKRSTYGCSFSTNGTGVEDDLMFWRLYGGDGNGCSLKLSGVPDRIYRVRYMGKSGGSSIPEEGEVKERLDRLLECMKETIKKAPDAYMPRVCQSMKQAIDQVLEGYFHLVKSAAYSHESEWRMISVCPKENSVKYAIGNDSIVRRYIDGSWMKDLLISKSKITLGPRVSNIEVARKYVESRVKKYELNLTTVCTSLAKYRRI